MNTIHTCFYETINFYAYFTVVNFKHNFNHNNYEKNTEHEKYDIQAKMYLIVDTANWQ